MAEPRKMAERAIARAHVDNATIRREEEHVVNIGKVQDSSSRKALPDADYAALREANVLDEILWHWARRAFLESLHCAP